MDDLSLRNMLMDFFITLSDASDPEVTKLLTLMAQTGNLSAEVKSQEKLVNKL